METLIERAARDLVGARHAIALTGAGISTESGIPEFPRALRRLDQEPRSRKTGLPQLRRFCRTQGVVARETGQPRCAGRHRQDSAQFRALRPS